MMSSAGLRSAVAALSVGFLLLGSPAPTRAAETAPAPASVAGRVLLADKSPARNVKVMAINLESREVVESTTGADGAYRITGLQMGYYDFAFEVDGKLYLADGVLTLEGDTRASFDLDTSIPEEREWWQSGAAKRLPILNRTPDGTARLTGETRSSFWRGRNGIAVLVAGGAAAVALALSGSGGSSSPTTP